MDKLIVDRLLKLDSCALSDALDRLGLVGVAAGIGAVWPCAGIAGRAITVRLKPVGAERPRQHLGVRAIEAALPGDIVVVDNAGRGDVGSWGGILALAASVKQVGGVILDGACRDVDEIRQMGLPVYARGVVPRTARGRVMEESFNDEIQCGRVRVAPGDFVRADGTGVVFIPQEKVQEVLALAEGIAQRENAMTEAIRAGQPVGEVLLGAGYEAMLGSSKPVDVVASSFQQLPITAISDALDRLGLQGTCLGISPVAVGYHVAGRAYTVKYELVGAERGTVGDFIDDVPPGSIVTLDNGGRVDVTVWGDLLTLAASRNGVAATVIDGVCRDSKRSTEIGYPIFSRGKYMRTGKDRVRMTGVNVAIEVGGAKVRPGDLLVGSDDGVVVVPRERETDVLDLAKRIEEAEGRIRAEILAGTPLREARQKHGYHQLQRSDR